jgi:hypothetical protein
MNHRPVYPMPVGLIRVGERLRPVDQELVERIARSILEVGQIAPIEVGPEVTKFKSRMQVRRPMQVDSVVVVRQAGSSPAMPIARAGR